MMALLLGATAAAMALVASLTGSWGAAFWAAALSPTATGAALYEAHTRPQRGESA